MHEIRCRLERVCIHSSIKFAQSYFSDMDALSEVLNSLKLKAVVYQKTQLCAPWGIAIGQDKYSQFWRLLQGECYIILPGEDSIKMKAGDFVLVPHGGAHCIMSHPGSNCVPSVDFVKALNAGKPMFQSDGPQTLLLGGHFEFTSSVLHPLVQSLPKIIRINSQLLEIRFWLEQAAAFMNDELTSNRAGSEVILGRLAEIVFILIIRSYIEEADVSPGFLRAFKDPKISASLDIMHAAPEKEWTLDQLGAAVGMSRSLYAKQFKLLLGETPLTYLTNWRILKSKEYLLNNKENISEIAERVGYQSEAAFNRVFKLKTGDTPAGFRRRILTE